MSLYILAVTIITVAIVISVLKILFADRDTQEKSKPRYHYTRKQFFLTRPEHECYDMLVAAVGETYYVFAQVHLSAILDNKVKGQSWRAAFAHINGKSVDFLLCDKAYISPKLAIELDDRTHERPDRKERDREVERILGNADIPLLRLKNTEALNAAELAQQIADAVS